MNKARSKPAPYPDLQKVSLVDRINIYFHFRRYFKMLGRRWFLLLFCCAIGVGVAAYRAFTTPDLYRASSTIGVAPKLQTVYDKQAQYLEELNFFYDSQLQYISGSEVMGRVHQKMRDAAPGAPPAIVRPSASKGRGSFSLTVESTDLEYARRFARIWPEEFIEFKTQQREKTLGRTAASTREEINRLTKNLKASRDALLDFQKKHNIGSVKETGDAAQQRLDKLLEEYQNILTLRQRLENRTKEELAIEPILAQPRRADDAASPPPDARPPEPPEPVEALSKFTSESRYAEFRARLRSRQTDWEHYRETLKPKHPFMVKLQREIDQLNKDIQIQLDLIEEKRVAQINSLRGDEASYQPIIDDLRTQVLDSRSVQYEYERLKEDEANIKNNLDNRLKALQSFDLAAVDESTFTVIEAGIGSSHPVSPNRTRMILMGLFLGLGVGVGLIYFLDKLDDRLELAEEIEDALDESVLGQIPLVKRTATDAPQLLVTRLDEHNMYAEAVRGVRSAILFAGDEEPKKVLLASSAVPGDGKTTFMVNFAITMAQSGHRVLLVDVDLRRGNTHQFFGNSRDPGLTEVLSGELHWTEVLRQSELDTLQTIHTGRLPSNPGELLISPVTREFLDEVRAEYDFVLLDCPPLTSIDDTFALLGLADGLIFVIRSGQTSMRFAKNALHAVHQRGAKVLGLVLNGIGPDNPYYYYQYYYYNYYSQEQPPPGGAQSTLPVKRMAQRRRHQPAISENNPQVTADEFKARRAAKQAAPAPPDSPPPA